MGVNRDLKKATESYWAGKLSLPDLIAEGKRLRLEHWEIQKKAGIDIIPSNDFSFYDQVLDHIQLFGVRERLVVDHQDGKLISDRPFRRDTPSTTFPTSMYTLPWVEASSDWKRVWMCLHW